MNRRINKYLGFFNTMKLLIIGGTGGTGKELIKQGLEQAHSYRIFGLRVALCECGMCVTVALALFVCVKS